MQLCELFYLMGVSSAISQPRMIIAKSRSGKLRGHRFRSHGCVGLSYNDFFRASSLISSPMALVLDAGFCTVSPFMSISVLRHHP